MISRSFLIIFICLVNIQTRNDHEVTFTATFLSRNANTGKPAS